VADEELFLDVWGEEITYKPKGGTQRTVLAIIDRNVPESLPQSPGGMGQNIQIVVANRKTSRDDDDYGGIGSDELNTGGDKVALPLSIGRTAVERPLGEIVRQDSGMITIQVR